MKLAAAGVLVAAAVLAARPAHADEGSGDASADGGAEPEPINPRQMATLAFKRARRAVALGPSVGGSVFAADGSVDGTVSFGLALSLFKVSVIPDREAIQAKAQPRLLEAAARAVAEGRPLTRDELEEVARRIYRDVIDEYSTERKGRLLEKPRLRFVLEAARSFDQGDWSARFGAGLGLGPVSLGASVTTLFAADVTLYLGPELSVQLLPGKGVRSPIIDLFLRADFAVAGGDTHLYGGGVRAILDII